MEEVAAKLRKSRRWLQDFLQDHPYYRLAGRTKVFTDEDIDRLIEALPCPGSSSRRDKGKRHTGTFGARTSESLWTTARELLTGGRPPRSSQHGDGAQNVVSFPSSNPMSTNPRRS
jgi:hypothetical protein